jgi:hypothetical protein
VSTTDKGRWLFRVLFVFVTLVALAGWLVWDRDPSKLNVVMGWIMGLNFAGEAANVGKRWTFKKEAVELEASPTR